MRHGDFYKVEQVSCQCGGTQAWFRLRDGVAYAHGCICHTPLPPDAKVIGDYLVRPDFVDDPLPLYDPVVTITAEPPRLNGWGQAAPNPAVLALADRLRRAPVAGTCKT